MPKYRQIAIYGKGGIGKSTTTQNLTAGLAVAAAGIIPNVIQGVVGIAISSLLYPVLHRLVKH